ncbi:hypothetical protein [Microcoleus sp. D3_18a_C4]|uniref:hypothetical protein n=1 Tax=Microcoleus sp. D3_18a_C4 TaxID=3055332 RepID=UPI002FD0A10D
MSNQPLDSSFNSPSNLPSLVDEALQKIQEYAQQSSASVSRFAKAVEEQKERAESNHSPRKPLIDTSVSAEANKMAGLNVLQQSSVNMQNNHMPHLANEIIS